MLDRDFGLNKINSVLIGFDGILFPLSKMLIVSSHDLYFYLSFLTICQIVVGLHHLHNDGHHYT